MNSRLRKKATIIFKRHNFMHRKKSKRLYIKNIEVQFFGTF